MKKLITLFIVICMTAPLAVAVTNSFSITPDDSFWEGTKANAVSDYAPGWDPGSFEAPGAYSKYIFSPEGLFGRSVTVGELAQISYYTKKDTLHTVDAGDWFFQMYTSPYDGSPGSSWYGNRINSEPYFSANLTETAGEWTLWDSAGTANTLRFFDSSTGYFGSYTDGFLSDLTSDSTYSSQNIMYLSVGLGTAWADGFDGQIDGLSIELTNGDVAEINFVPEPATLSLLGLGGLLLRKRRA